MQSFEERKEQLEVLAESAKLLSITDFNDRESLKIISAKRKELKAARVKVEGEGKTMRDQVRPITNLISEKEKELVAIIEPEEKRLSEFESWVESEKERVRQEEIKAENDRIQSRIDALAKFGYQIDYADLKTMSNETFNNYLKAAEAQYNKEQEEKAEAERVRLENEEKERIAREEEQKRIESERAELQRLREEAAKSQAIIDENNARIKKEQEEKEAAIRAEQQRIADEKAAIEEQRRKEEEAKQRAKEIEKAKAEAAEKARLKAIEDARVAEEKRIEDERKAKELADRRAARQPDKIKIQNYVAALNAVVKPELKTQDAKDVFSQIDELLARLTKYSTEKYQTL